MAIGGALTVLGLTLAWLVSVDGHLIFVKQSLTVPLYLSTAVLVVLGGMTLRGRDGGAAPLADGADDHDGLHHGHVGHGPRMGILLLAPLVVLLLVPPTALGAFAANNGAANRFVSVATLEELPAPGADGAVDLVLTEVVSRALAEPASIDGVTVRTEGFVVVDDDGSGGYLLSRFAIGCCAVDATPFQLLVRTDDVPPEEAWVRADLRFTGEVVTADGTPLPVFDLVTQERITEPVEPYLY